jgi:hypothetical protein
MNEKQCRKFLADITHGCAYRLNEGYANYGQMGDELRMIQLTIAKRTVTNDE